MIYDDHGQVTAGGYAAMAGLGGIGTGSVANLIKVLEAEREHASRPRTRSRADFHSKLQPGDIIFSRESGKAKQPTIRNILAAIKGDQIYHSGVYAGEGREYGMIDPGRGLKSMRDHQLSPREALAYRPKSDADRRAALEYLRKAHQEKQKYASLGDMWRNVRSHLFSFSGGPDAKDPKWCKGPTCNELTGKAYGNIMGKQYGSATEMRMNPNLEFVARYDPVGPISKTQKALSRGVYPLLKSLKWGGAAGLAGLGVGALATMGDET